MKKRHNIVFSTALVIVLLAIGHGFAVPVVNLMVGDVQYQKGGDTVWLAAKQGQELALGDLLKAGTDSYAEIVDGGNVIRLNAESTIKMSTSVVNEEKSSSISLFIGSILLKIKKLSKDDQGFGVETPTAYCAVRGTEFVVASGYEGETLVQVNEGVVTLRGDEKEVTIKENEESIVELGGEPSRVTRLKKRAWMQWARESRARIRGQEVKVIRSCFVRMNKLDRDITALEERHKEFTKQKLEYLEKVKEYRRLKDQRLYREYAIKAHRARRSAYVAIIMTYYKAEKMSLIRGVALNAYDAAPRKTDRMVRAMQRIDEVYQKNYEKYIREIDSQRGLKEQIRKKRQKK